MTNDENNTIPLKKRGRKPKKVLCENDLNTDLNNGTNINMLIEEISDMQDITHVAKKRGRKPKGGKIIQEVVQHNNNNESQTNVILHLKCFLKDLLQSSLLNEDIQSFNFSNKQFTYTNDFNEQNATPQPKYNTNSEYDDYDNETNPCENASKEVWKKIKVLEHNLHTNNISDKKSACFWCTCEFDNPPVYIPKFHLKNTYHVYGCFCSPECATAFLMEENIDTSSKFERYHLINTIYSKIYDYKKNIKPAPNPYYMLDKFYGNLSIQEYRSLLRNERLFLIVDKPLTRILPELHEDNDDFIINNTLIPSNTYQVKKKMQPKQTKATILNEKFGLAQ